MAETIIDGQREPLERQSRGSLGDTLRPDGSVRETFIRTGPDGRLKFQKPVEAEEIELVSIVAEATIDSAAIDVSTGISGSDIVGAADVSEASIGTGSELALDSIVAQAGLNEPAIGGSKAIETDDVEAVATVSEADVGVAFGLQVGDGDSFLLISDTLFLRVN